MEPFPPIETSPIFFDASGRRASRLRRVTQVLGVLALLYVGLLVASLLRVPGASRISLPAVGRLFPEGLTALPPSVENAPNVTVVAASGSGPRAAATPVKSSASTATTTGSPAAAASTPASVRPRATNAGVGNGGTTRGTTGGTTANTSASNGRGPDGGGPPGQVNKSSTDTNTGTNGNSNGMGGGKPR